MGFVKPVGIVAEEFVFWILYLSEDRLYVTILNAHANNL